MKLCFLVAAHYNCTFIIWQICAHMMCICCRTVLSFLTHLNSVVFLIGSSKHCVTHVFISVSIKLGDL